MGDLHRGGEAPFFFVGSPSHLPVYHALLLASTSPMAVFQTWLQSVLSFWLHGRNTGDLLNLCKPQVSDFLASILQSFTSLMLRHPKLGLCTGSTHSVEQLHLRWLGIKHRCLSTQQKSCVSSFYYIYLWQVFWSLIVVLWTSLFAKLNNTFIPGFVLSHLYSLLTNIPNSCIICVPLSILAIVA